ncbi:hypothetical protein [Variovorax rhizosphaerae]|uniref:Uncharacterized protein n=1 Tax=Variovorax rhizosphaerae TaxID=1836200 RepID=A0ABU8WYT1_9BURK
MLAESLRTPGSADAEKTESVGAALESVSPRHTNGDFLQRFAFGVLRAYHAAAEALSSMFRVKVSIGQSRSRAPMSSSSAPSRSIELTPTTLVQFLLVAERGDGLSPDICDALVRHRLVEWVDAASGLPIDQNSPYSLLRATPQGRARLEAVEMPVASA